MSATPGGQGAGTKVSPLEKMNTQAEWLYNESGLEMEELVKFFDMISKVFSPPLFQKPAGKGDAIPSFFSTVQINPNCTTEIGEERSLQEALDIFSGMIVTLTSHFHEISNSLKATIIEGLKNIKQSRDSELSLIRDSLGKSISQYNGLVQILAEYKKQSDLAGLNDALVLVVTKSVEPDSKMVNKMSESFEKILNTRKKNQANRDLLVDPGQMAIDLYRKNLNDLIAYIRKQNQLIIQNLNFVNETYENASENVIQITNKIKKQAKETNFDSDIPYFLSKSRIFRYELKPKPFQFLKCDAVQCEPVDVPPEIPLDVPIGLAKVTHQHDANGANQISVKLNKMVYLLEEPKGKWVYCQNPFTQQVGFIPSYCVQPIGYALGVALENDGTPIGANDLAPQPGDFLAIIKDANVQKFIVMNICGKEGQINKSRVGLIYAFKQ